MATVAAGLSVLLAATGATQEARPGEQLIYADSLANGWRDVSRANLSAEAGAPVRSGRASIGVRLDAWQLLNLRRDALDTSIYSSLMFWIHGGPSGGQRLRVAAAIRDAGLPPVTLSPLAANAW